MITSSKTASKQTEHDLSNLEDIPGFLLTDPTYYSDPNVDTLVEICLLLGAEIWTNRSRQLIMEELLERNGSVTKDAVESFVPDEDFNAKVLKQRKAFVKRVYKSLYADKFIDENENFFKWLAE